MRPRTLTLLPLVPLALALLLAPPRVGAAAPAPPAGPGGVLEMHARLFAALDRGDGDAVAALLAPDEPGRGEALGGRRAHVVLDGDHPRSACGAEAAGRVLRHWPKLWRSDRAGVATAIVAHQVECGSEDLAYAVLELERTFERGDERATDRLHVTSLGAWRGGAWRIFHLHVSSARAPLHTRR